MAARVSEVARGCDVDLVGGEADVAVRVLGETFKGLADVAGAGGMLLTGNDEISVGRIMADDPVHVHWLGLELIVPLLFLVLDRVLDRTGIGARRAISGGV